MCLRKLGGNGTISRMRCVASGMPDTLEVDLTDDLSFGLDLEPIINAIGNTECVKLYQSLTN